MSDSIEKTKSEAQRVYDSVVKRYDLPRDELLKQLSAIKTGSQGHSRLYFKFTCSNCKARCMFGTADVLYEIGVCPDCGKETEIAEAGFMVVTNFRKKGQPNEGEQNPE